MDGRWLGRDDIEEIGGINLYSFKENKHSTFFDTLGLAVLNWHHVIPRKFKCYFPKNMSIDSKENGIILINYEHASLHKDWNRQVEIVVKRRLRRKSKPKLTKREVESLIDMFKKKFYNRKDVTYYIEDSIDYKKWNSLSAADKDAFSYEFFDELDLDRVNAQNGGSGKLYTKADKPLAPSKFKFSVKNLNPWLKKVAQKVGKVAIKKAPKKIPIIGTGITIYAVYEGYQEDGVKGAVINLVF